MEFHKVETALIVVLFVLLVGALVWGVTDSRNEEGNREYQDEIRDLESQLAQTEGLLDKYDGVTVCNVWFEGEGFYRIYCGDNLISEFRNSSDSDRTMVSVPIHWKDYPGRAFVIDVYKDDVYARALAFDVDVLKEEQTQSTVDTVDMRGY